MHRPGIESRFYHNHTIRLNARRTHLVPDLVKGNFISMKYRSSGLFDFQCTEPDSERGRSLVSAYKCQWLDDCPFRFGHGVFVFVTAIVETLNNLNVFDNYKLQTKGVVVAHSGYSAMSWFETRKQPPPWQSSDRFHSYLKFVKLLICLACMF